MVIEQVSRQLDEEQLSALIRVSMKTLQRWRIEGIGPRWRKYGTARTSAVRYDERDVAAWLDSRRTGGGAGVPECAGASVA